MIVLSASGKSQTGSSQTQTSWELWNGAPGEAESSVNRNAARPLTFGARQLPVGGPGITWGIWFLWRSQTYQLDFYVKAYDFRYWHPDFKIRKHGMGPTKPSEAWLLLTQPRSFPSLL